jgi:nitrogen regulatory protein P-II 1
MKRIEAIIKLSKLDEVQHALEEIGIDGMTVCEVKGFGRQNRHVETYRGNEYTVDFLPKIKIDLVVLEQTAAQAVKIIINSAKTGGAGDDKIYISNVQDARCSFAI